MGADETAFSARKKAECMCAPWSGPAMKKRML